MWTGARSGWMVRSVSFGQCYEQALELLHQHRRAGLIKRGKEAARQIPAPWLRSSNKPLHQPMSIEAFTKFLDANPEVAKKVAACQNYNEVAEIAKANGINVSGAELTKFAAKQTAELSDEDLEAVAGGTWTGNQAVDTIISVNVAIK